MSRIVPSAVATVAVVLAGVGVAAGSGEEAVVPLEEAKEVLATERGGNQTLSSGEFRTR